MLGRFGELRGVPIDIELKFPQDFAEVTEGEGPELRMYILQGPFNISIDVDLVAIGKFQAAEGPEMLGLEDGLGGARALVAEVSLPEHLVVVVDLVDRANRDVAFLRDDGVFDVLVQVLDDFEGRTFVK